MKILHIDDLPEICALYTEMFTTDNHCVQSTTNGKEGLDLAVKNDYDLILLDVCMPKYSGLDFLHDLQSKKPSELKKIVITSVLQFTDSQIKRLKKFGIHSVEEKPRNIQQMERIQKDMLLREK